MKADINLELFLDEDAQILSKHIELLKAIKKTKSITKAAEYVGISYKNAWDSLDTLNNKSHKPLIIRAEGNKKNSGSSISEYGEKMIEIYDTILKTQKEYLSKICSKVDFEDIDIINLQRMAMSLSARNQLNCEITQINSGAVNTEVVARLSNGEYLSANITTESEKNLNLKVGKKVIYIFKAPSVILQKGDDGIKLSTQNVLHGSVIQAKIGAVNAEITLKLSNDQTLTATITKDSAMELKIGVGDKLKAIIKSSQIIIGV
ncbi:TOBE domain-containing protein [Campylobacter sp. faydin G-140]|uniref:TOBE domain-containing protein n=1 Tax=Campylobacter anatolicus TaxID=2829105 RepID=UPI001B94B0E8|nr:TOBE domain-containing protein [Campylobacter anatolicus]MBR8462264.1 TOBE domain-containing protein [Campylobacter anatolicus]MBR8465404.1 TOBE domain-containing protein [Campylobacter anatolicus]